MKAEFIADPPDWGRQLASDLIVASARGMRAGLAGAAAAALIEIQLALERIRFSGSLGDSFHLVVGLRQATISSDKPHAGIMNWGGTVKPKKGPFLTFAYGSGAFVKIREARISGIHYLEKAAQQDAAMASAFEETFAKELTRFLVNKHGGRM